MAQCLEAARGTAAPQFHVDMTCAELNNGDGCIPRGACCVSEGPDGYCLDITEAECDDHEFASWQECIECTLVQCEPIGACIVDVATCHVLPESECLVINGTFMGANTACEWVPDGCEGDANDNGFVDIDDLLIVIADWGQNGAADGNLNDDNIVDIQDLLLVISNWGDDCTFDN